MKIRKATEQDLPDILRLFRETVSAINKKDYTGDQIKEWLKGADDVEKWRQRIQSQYFLTADYQTKIIGFASISTDGYLDVLFVHKDHQRKGTAKTLLEKLVAFANKNALKEIVTDASITARPFFDKFGFQVITEQTVNRNGVRVTNFKMLKPLG